MKPGWIVVAGLLTATTTSAAAPPVGPLTVARLANDLVLTWQPPATVVDGYRVFRADDVGCVRNVPIYRGAQPTFTVVDGVLDSRPGLYRVTSYVGADESVPSPPVYSYRIALRKSTVNALSHHLLSVFPQGPSLDSAQDWCTDLNGQANVDRPVTAIFRYASDTALFRNDQCSSSLEIFNLQQGVADFVTLVFADATDVSLWGVTPSPLSIALPAVYGYDPNRHSGYGRNEYMVSLPYDHDYTDLMAVAADLPAAVQIRVHDPDYICWSAPCAKAGFGLGRATPADPWSGANLNLYDRRGEGLMIGVAAPTAWTPRRQCTGPANLGGWVQTLLAVASGDDIELRWDTDQSAGALRYDVYRVDTLAALANLDAQPVYRTLAAMPTFPVVDLGAGLLPGPLYYAVRVY